MKSLFQSVTQNVLFLLKHEAPTFKHAQSQQKLKSIQKNIQLVHDLLSSIQQKNDAVSIDKKLQDVSLNEFAQMLEETMSDNNINDNDVPSTVGQKDTTVSKSAPKLAKIHLAPVSFSRCFSPLFCC